MWWDNFISSVWGEIFVQTLGAFGVFCMIISVQFNTHKKIMFYKTVGTFAFVLQYFLLKAYTGMILDFIGIFRNIVFTNNVLKKKSNKNWIIFFTIFTIVVGILSIIFTWNDLISRLTIWNLPATLTIILSIIVSIFSIIAKSLTTIAYGLTDLDRLRKLNFSSSTLWFFYNLSYLVVSGIINEILVMSSIIIAQIRFRKNKTSK